MTARDTAVERARLDLLFDERDRCGDALVHRPRHLGLRGDREIAPDVLEERPLGFREVLRVARKPLHRLLTGIQHGFPVLRTLSNRHVRIYQVLDGAINGSRVLIHTVLDVEGSFVHFQSAVCLVNPPQSSVNRGLTVLLSRSTRPL